MDSSRLFFPGSLAVFLKIAAKPLRISEFWIFLGGLLAAFGGEMSSDYFQNTPFFWKLQWVFGRRGGFGDQIEWNFG